MKDIHLMEFEPVSMLRVQNREVTRPMMPVFDIHTHMRGADTAAGLCDLDRYVRGMEESGVKRVVDLDGFYGPYLEESMRRKQGFEDRIDTFCTVDLTDVEAADFETTTHNALRRAHGMGVRGLKFLKSIGLGYRKRDGSYLRPDDPRLGVIWQTAAELSMPVLIHIADPEAFFTPLGRHNERIEELAANPEWHFGQPQYPSFDALMQMQENMLSANRDTRFILAHVGNHAEDLASVADQLDRYPSVYVDIAARIAELGRQPYTARKFLTEYQTRVLFGTDALTRAGDTHDIFQNNPIYYAFLETYNEYFPANAREQQGRWNIYGVGLDADVLKNIYWNNACRCLNRPEDVV